VSDASGAVSKLGCLTFVPVLSIPESNDKFPNAILYLPCMVVIMNHPVTTLFLSITAVTFYLIINIDHYD
jgi:hypothetical protein